MSLLLLFFITIGKSIIPNQNRINRAVDDNTNLLLCDQNVTSCTCSEYVANDLSCTQHQLSGNQSFEDVVIQDENTRNYYFVFSANSSFLYHFGSNNISSITLIGEKSATYVTSNTVGFPNANLILNKVLLTINSAYMYSLPTLKYIDGGRITNTENLGMLSYLDLTPQEYSDKYQGLRSSILNFALFDNDLNDKNHTILFKEDGFLIDSDIAFYNLSKNSLTLINYYCKSSSIVAGTERMLTIAFQDYTGENPNFYYDIQSGSLIINIVNISRKEVLCFSDRNDALIFDPFILNSFTFSKNDKNKELFLSSNNILNSLICFGKGQCSIPEDNKKATHYVVFQRQLNSMFTEFSKLSRNPQLGNNFDVSLIGTSSDIEVDLSHADLNHYYLQLGNNISHCTYTITNSANITTNINLFNSTLKLKSDIEFRTHLINVTIGSKVENLNHIQTENFIIQKEELPIYQSIKTTNLTINGLNEISSLENSIILSNEIIKINEEDIKIANISAERLLLVLPINISKDIPTTENIQCKVKLENESITKPPSLYLSFDGPQTKNFYILNFAGNWSHVTNNPIIYCLSYKYVELKNFPYKYARYHLDYINKNTKTIFLYDQHPFIVPFLNFHICMDNQNFNLPTSGNEKTTCLSQQSSIEGPYRNIRSFEDLDFFFSDLHADVNIFFLYNFLSEPYCIPIKLTKMQSNVKINQFQIIHLETNSNASITTPSVAPVGEFDLYGGDYISFVEPNKKRITINTIQILNHFFSDTTGVSNLKIVGNFQEIRKATVRKENDIVTVAGLACQQVVAIVSENSDKENATIKFVNRGFIMDNTKGDHLVFNINENNIYTNNFSFHYYPRKSSNIVLSLDPIAASTAMSVEIFIDDVSFQGDFKIEFDQSFNSLEKDIAILFSANDSSKYFANDPSNISTKLHVFSKREDFKEYKDKDNIPMYTPTNEPETTESSNTPTTSSAISSTTSSVVSSTTSSVVSSTTSQTNVPTKEPDFVEPEEPEEMETPIQSDNSDFDISKDIAGGNSTNNKPIVVEFTQKDITISGNTTSSKEIYFTPTKEDSIITIVGDEEKDFGNATYGVKITTVKSTIVIQTTKVPLNIISEDEETQLVLDVSQSSGNPGEISKDKIELNKLTVNKGHFNLFLPSTVKVLELANIILYQVSTISLKQKTESLLNLLSLASNRNIQRMKEEKVKIATNSLELMKGSNTIVDKIELSNKATLNEGSKLTVNDELILKPDKTNLVFKITSNVNLVSIPNQTPIINFNKCLTYPLNISILIAPSQTSSTKLSSSILSNDEITKSAVKLVCGDSFTTCSTWKDIISEQTNYKHNECQEIEEKQCLVIRNYDLDKEDGDGDVKGKKLKGGEIAGIVIGCIVLVGIVIGIIVYFVVIKKKDTNSSDNGSMIGRDNSTKL